MKARFDDSLTSLASVLTRELGPDCLTAGIALRDMQGRLCFFLADTIQESEVQRIGEHLRAALGGYARSDRVLVSADDIGAETILREVPAFEASTPAGTVRLIDRRLVGADWLRRPAPIAPPPPRFVFASLKGGVGRTTAIAVCAADLAAHGRRVLVVDLDMEAPGLGAILLDQGTTPDFGVVDALVENGLSGIDDTFLSDMIGPSSLADRHGRIDVAPAFGRRSLDNPANVLSKLSRAYGEDINENGAVASLLDQVRELVDRLVKYGTYDAVLIDARAGLHETTASAILGLGADVFLFGLDEPQTFQGYQFLLSHLGQVNLKGEAVIADWIDRLTMVQGKAPADQDSRAAFVERCREMFERSRLVATRNGHNTVSMPGGEFSKVPWDDDAMRSESIETDRAVSAIAILEDDRYKNFAPIDRRDLLLGDMYNAAYGELIRQVRQALDAPAAG